MISLQGEANAKKKKIYTKHFHSYTSIKSHLTKKICFTGEWGPLNYCFYIFTPITRRRPYNLVPFLSSSFIVKLEISHNNYDQKCKGV